MKVYSLTELFRLTRSDLFALHGEVMAVLIRLPDGSPELPAALETLRLIRNVTSRPRLLP